tara:strand:- start:659 stop:1453 length:795 start_codon:yes stop_codon:yes gene_type:complete
MENYNQSSEKQSLLEKAVSLSNKELKKLCNDLNINTNSVLEKHEYAELLVEKQIQEKTKKLFKPAECSICYEELGDKNNCTTPCGHVFCFECMMQALNRNNTCPCCRAPLKEELEEESEEEDEEEDYEWDVDEESIGHGWGGVSHSIPITGPFIHREFIQNIKNTQFANPETISNKIAASGYNMEDIVSLLLHRIDRTTKSHSYVTKMISDIESIIKDEDMDKHDRENEAWGMEQEDTRMREINDRDIFDIHPDLDLNLLFNTE